MPDKVRRTKITIERREITIIRNIRKRISVYCRRCQTKVPVLTPDEIAVRLQISIGEISSLVQTGEIHLIETTEGSLPLICGGPGKEKLF